jgi:hypothetical protein
VGAPKITTPDDVLATAREMLICFNIPDEVLQDSLGLFTFKDVVQTIIEVLNFPYCNRNRAQYFALKQWKELSRNAYAPNNGDIFENYQSGEAFLLHNSKLNVI